MQACLVAGDGVGGVCQLMLGKGSWLPLFISLVVWRPPMTQVVDTSEISSGQPALNHRSPAYPFLFLPSTPAELQPSGRLHESPIHPLQCHFGSCVPTFDIILLCPFVTHFQTNPGFNIHCPSSAHASNYTSFPHLCCSLSAQNSHRLLLDSLSLCACHSPTSSPSLPSFAIALTTPPIPHLVLFPIHSQHPQYKTQPTKPSSCCASPPSHQQSAPTLRHGYIFPSASSGPAEFVVCTAPHLSPHESRNTYLCCPSHTLRLESLMSPARSSSSSCPLRSTP